MTSRDGYLERLAHVRTQRERGDLKQILARYGTIDQDQGPLWNDVDFVLEIARVYSLVGNDAKVEQYFLRCAQLNPRRAALYRGQIGWFFQRKKRWARALCWYDRALETFPTYHLCLFRKGYCLERLHRPRAAAAALDAACASYDKAPEEQRERSRGIQVQVLFHLARNLREIGDTARARAALDRCAELDDRLHEKVIKPEHRLASYGETYLRDGEPAAAIVQLEAAREIDPGSAVIWERLGRAYQQAGRIEEAEAALRRATELPKGAVALIALGRLLTAQRRWREAAQAYADALRLHPQGEVQVRMEMAELQSALGRPQAALDELERLAAGRVPPQSTLAVAVESRIAAILLEHGRRARALAHLEAAVANDPDRADTRARLEEVRDASSADAAAEPPDGNPLPDAPLPDDVAAVLGHDAAPRLTGTVSSYFPERGFGFILHGNDARALFFHVSQCEPSPPPGLAPGAEVTFVLGVNHRSRKPQAEHVRVVAVDRRPDPPQPAAAAGALPAPPAPGPVRHRTV
jgi:tetratricopeptide (TPR) repeat protein